MIAALFARWRLYGAVTLALALGGYVAWLNVALAHERTITARLDADLAQALAAADLCTGNLAATIKDKLTDETARNLTAAELRRALAEWVRDDLADR